MSREQSREVGQDILCWTMLFFKSSGHLHGLPSPRPSCPKQGLEQAAGSADVLMVPVANCGHAKRCWEGRGAVSSYSLEYYPEASINIRYLLPKALCQRTVITYNLNAETRERKRHCPFYRWKTSCGALKFLALGHTGSWWQNKKES